MSRFPTLTGSGLWRSMLCIGSAVLPKAGSQSQWTNRGNVIHKFFLDVNRLGGAYAGREPALALVEDEELRSVCELLNLEGLPLDPLSYAAEVAIAYDVITGRAAELHRKGDRDYSMVDFSRQIPMTLDVIGVAPDRVIVIDWKPGFAFVTDPELNMQFRAGALIASRLWGRFHAEVRMIRFREDGEPYTIVREFDLFALAEIAEELRELHARAMEAAVAVEDGAEPKLVTGSHCDGCDSIAFCPAMTSMIRAAVREPDAVAVGMAQKLTREHALEAYQQYQALLTLVARMEKELKAYAKFDPIPLPDGRVYGPHESHRDNLNGQKVWHELAKLVGPDEAWKVTKIAATKKDILGLAERLFDNLTRDGIDSASEPVRLLVDKVLARPTKRKGGSKLAKTPLYQALLDDLAATGAMKTSYFESVGEHTPPKELKS